MFARFKDPEAYYQLTCTDCQQYKTGRGHDLESPSAQLHTCEKSRKVTFYNRVKEISQP